MNKPVNTTNSVDTFNKIFAESVARFGDSAEQPVEYVKDVQTIIDDILNLQLSEKSNNASRVASKLKKFVKKLSENPNLVLDGRTVLLLIKKSREVGDIISLKMLLELAQENKFEGWNNSHTNEIRLMQRSNGYEEHIIPLLSQITISQTNQNELEFAKIGEIIESNEHESNDTLNERRAELREIVEGIFSSTHSIEKRDLSLVVEACNMLGDIDSLGIAAGSPAVQYFDEWDKYNLMHFAEMESHADYGTLVWDSLVTIDRVKDLLLARVKPSEAQKLSNMLRNGIRCAQIEKQFLAYIQSEEFSKQNKIHPQEFRILSRVSEAIKSKTCAGNFIRSDAFQKTEHAPADSLTQLSSLCANVQDLDLLECLQSSKCWIDTEKSSKKLLETKSSNTHDPSVENQTNSAIEIGIEGNPDNKKPRLVQNNHIDGNTNTNSNESSKITPIEAPVINPDVLGALQANCESVTVGINNNRFTDASNEAIAELQAVIAKVQDQLDKEKILSDERAAAEELLTNAVKEELLSRGAASGNS